MERYDTTWTVTKNPRTDSTQKLPGSLTAFFVARKSFLAEAVEFRETFLSRTIELFLLIICFFKLKVCALRIIHRSLHLVKLKKLKIAHFSVCAPVLLLSNSLCIKSKKITATTQHVHKYGKYALCALDLVKIWFHVFSTRFE